MTPDFMPLDSAWLPPALWVAGRILDELLLFCAVGFLIGGLDDLAIDLFHLWRRLRYRVLIQPLFPRATLATLPPSPDPGLFAVFVPAWDEGTVIAAMLANATRAWAGARYRIFVGTYPNDPATSTAIRKLGHDHIAQICGSRPGPTSKAECLNRLWQALIDDEQASGRRYKGIVLHDAEDVVHAGEIALFDRMLDRAAFVQIPVIPLISRRSRWIAGHYADEFAEAHGKALPAREALGAGLPTAGVGCAIRRDVIARIAERRGGLPFDEASLTEDYELGLGIAEAGGRGLFVRLRSGTRARDLVAVHAHFPEHLDAAVRQKARWIAGIALAGWDRLGWRGGLAERWMRLHDRRAVLAALILLAAYAALLGGAVLALFVWLMNAPMPPLSSTLKAVLPFCTGLLIWRLAVRAWFVRRTYGWNEAARSIPRAIISNIIAMMAVRRAVLLYLAIRRDGRVHWEKTTHIFPTAPQA